MTLDEMSEGLRRIDSGKPFNSVFRADYPEDALLDQDGNPILPVNRNSGEDFMNFKERFHRLAKGLGLDVHQLAEIFGVSYDTMLDWYLGKTIPQHEFRQTLLRLESDNMPALSPHLREDTLRAFREGRERLVLEEK